MTQFSRCRASKSPEIPQMLNMLAVSKTSNDQTSINILPCRINHNGPAKVTKRHWQPRAESDGTKTSHFRGRRLRGKAVQLPDGYQGIVLKPSDKTIVEPILPSEEDEEPELPEPIKVAEQVATFEEITVWGHDQIPAADYQLIKGVEEWIRFAQLIHGR